MVVDVIVVSGYEWLVVKVGDLLKEEIVGGVIRMVVEIYGMFDVFVNNVGGGIIKLFFEYILDILCIIIDCNLWMIVWCIWYVVFIMKEKGYGCVVNIGVDLVWNGLWDYVVYNVVKGGVYVIVMGLVWEFVKDGIIFNVVVLCIVNML